MKKRVYRERYNVSEEIKDLGSKLQPLMKMIVESKKYYKPKIAKELKKKSDK